MNPPSRSERYRQSKVDQRSLNTQEYTIVNPLRPPCSTSHSVMTLYEQIMDGSIKLDSDYQRDVLWPRKMYISLIDSIFRNYYIPPIIFAIVTTDDGSEIRICIDGEQRLRSIEMFMDGQIPHRDHITDKCYWYKKSELREHSLLPERLQRSFRHKQILCVEYDSLTKAQQREIFQRVQPGLPPTLAERLETIVGPWPDFVREIQSQVIGDDGFGGSFGWGRDSWRDFRGLASVVYLIEQLPVTRVLPTDHTLETWLTRTTPIPPEIRTDVIDTFRVYLSLAEDDIYKKPFARRVYSTEFIVIGFMVFMERETLSLTQLSHAVEVMRADLRSKDENTDLLSIDRISELFFEFRLKVAKPRSA